MRRDGLIRQMTKGLTSNIAINSQLSVTGTGQNRRKKGLIQSKKIPDKFLIREYDTNEMSSKWDVKIKTILDTNALSINDDRHYLNDQDKSKQDQRYTVGASTAQLKSLFFQKEEDLEEDNTKKMVQFYYHGKNFTYCKESCQIFKKEHLIRRLSVWITEWNFYKFLTFITILTMSVFMGMHNYQQTDEENIQTGGFQSIFSYTKYFYISYFAIEILLKIIARGLYQSPNSYLRNINNCIIIIIFIIITIYDTSFIFLLIFRIFYIFEFTSKIKFLKQSYTILKLYSFSAETLCKLFFLIFFFITLFGILATSIWSGAMDNRCRLTPTPGEGTWELAPINRLCGGRYSCPSQYYCGSNYDYIRTSQSYINSDVIDDPIKQREFNYGITNFDNMLRSYLTLFQILLVEGYYNIMYMVEDSHDPLIPVIFITCYFLVCTYFLNNLIIAIFFIKYQQIESDEDKKNQQQKKKYNLVRFLGNQQQQQSMQADNMTLNFSSNTNPNSVYNFKIGQIESYPKYNNSRVFPDHLVKQNNNNNNNNHNREHLIQRKNKKKSTLTNIQSSNSNIRRQKSKSMQNMCVSGTNTQGALQSIDETEENEIKKNNKNKLKQEPLIQRASFISKDDNEVRDRKFTFENSEFEEGRKQKLSLGGGEYESRAFFNHNNSNNNNEINTKNSSFHNLRQNFSTTQFVKRRNFSKIPFTPSMIGASLVNYPLAKHLFNSKMNMSENSQKDEWNERIKNMIDTTLNNKIFIFIINFCILLNLIVLSFNQYPNSEGDLNYTIKKLNFTFILIFLIEDFMRLFQSQKTYYFVILTLEIIIDIISIVSYGKSNDLVPLSALKGLRILYVFTNMNSWVHYRILIDAINHSISSVLNILVIAFSFMYLGTIIGMWLFGGKLKFNNDGVLDLVNGNSPRFNFDDILTAFSSVFTIIQGDYWNNIWMDCVRSVGGWTAHPYFIILMISGKLVFINSFTAIMLTSFEYAKKKSEHDVNGAKAVIDQLSSLRYMKKRNQNVKKEQLKYQIEKLDNNIANHNNNALNKSKEKEDLKSLKLSKITSKKDSVHEKEQEINNEEVKSSSAESDKINDSKLSQKEIGRSKTLEVRKNNLESEFQTEGEALLTQSIQNPSNRENRDKLDNRDKGFPTLKHMKSLKENNTSPKDQLEENNKIQKIENPPIIQQQFKGFFKSNTIVPESTIKKSAFSQNIKNLRSKYKEQFLNKNQHESKKENRRLGAVGFYLKYSSCFIFHKNSFIRVKCQKLIQSHHWDNFFLLHIICSSIQLAMDNPLDDPNTTYKSVLNIIDIYFTVIFMTETIFKVISYGFLYNFTSPSKAYIRSAWNILDLFINITSIIDQSGVLSTNSLKSLKSLRALRALRPLRVLTKNESLRLLVNALFQTIPVLASLAFVTLTSTWIFAIFLMSQFKGKFQYCQFNNIDKIVNTPFYKSIVTIQDCEQKGGEWKNQDYNFDTIFLSLSSIFKIILGENWSILMWSSVDSSSQEQQPIENYTGSYQLFYYLLVFMGNIFTINLFTGLVVNNFKRIKDALSGYNTLTGIQRQWVEMQKFMMKRRLKVVIPNPSNIYRNFCFKLQKSPIFEKIIIAFILINLITMGCTYKGISSSGVDAINIINNTCLVIYHIEAIIKIIGVGIFFYFKDDWNKFDFAVISVTDIVLFSSLFISTSTLQNLPVIFRSLRLGRIVKYIRASHSLKVLIDSIYYLLPSLINIALLIFLLVFICAILGMNLFSSSMVVDKDSFYPYFDERVSYPFQYNFQTLSGSILIILQCIQNQNWDWYMSLYGYNQEGCIQQTYDDQQQDGVKGCGTLVSFPFFIIIVFFLRYIVINLFLALVVEGYSETLRESEAVITPEMLEIIIEKWSEYDQNGTGFIPPEDVYNLLVNLPEPIGLKNENYQNQLNNNDSKKDKKNKMMYISKKKIFEDLIDFNVRLYGNDKTHFMDFCVKLSRNAIIRKAKENNIIDPFLIHGRIVIEDSLLENLMKNWESEFPNLKKFNKRKDERDQPKHFFNIMNYYAAVTIQEYVRKTQREKKIKNQILENKIKNKIQKTENANNFSGGNSQKPKLPPRRQEKRQLSHLYINQPMTQVSNAGNTQLKHTPTDRSNQYSQDDQDNYNLNGYDHNRQEKGEKIIENTPQKLNNEHKAKFFSKSPIPSSQNGNLSNNQINKKSQHEIEYKNQDNLKKFQQFHNFTIKKDQLGQKFPIKYATDYESLRPTDQPRKITIEEFPLYKNDGQDQSLGRKATIIQQYSLSNLEKVQQQGFTAKLAYSPKNLRIEGLDSIQGTDQYYEMREKFTQNNFSPKDNGQMNDDEQYMRSKNDVDIILGSDLTRNQSKRDSKVPSETHSTEVDPSISSQNNQIKKNNYTDQ